MNKSIEQLEMTRQEALLVYSDCKVKLETAKLIYKSAKNALAAEQRKQKLADLSETINNKQIDFRCLDKFPIYECSPVAKEFVQYVPDAQPLKTKEEVFHNTKYPVELLPVGKCFIVFYDGLDKQQVINLRGSLKGIISKFNRFSRGTFKLIKHDIYFEFVRIA